jgi:uncharacterized Zn finger protein
MWRSRDRYRDRYSMFPKRATVGELQVKAAKARAKLEVAGRKLEPVVITGGGRKIATTWWGQAWCANLERYADFAYRIGRGRSYVRNGMVIDLRIAASRVDALVQGSQAKPYAIQIKIDPLAASLRAQVEAACRDRIGSLGDLLAGKFPKELEALFTAEGHGLFPTPREIHFSCSCPDVAGTCKHVAAALYGIGARFDQDAALFFALRGIDPQTLVGAALKQKTDELLAKAAPAPRAGRRVADADLGAVFGIDLGDPIATPATPAPATPAPAATSLPPRAPEAIARRAAAANRAPAVKTVKPGRKAKPAAKAASPAAKTALARTTTCTRCNVCK